ncbi:hypothetical protein GEMRC1_012932 [Eukaryota sp. GEM-RC1]
MQTSWSEGPIIFTSGSVPSVFTHILSKQKVRDLQEFERVVAKPLPSEILLPFTKSAKRTLDSTYIKDPPVAPLVTEINTPPLKQKRNSYISPSSPTLCKHIECLNMLPSGVRGPFCNDKCKYRRNNLRGGRVKPKERQIFLHQVLCRLLDLNVEGSPSVCFDLLRDIPSTLYESFAVDEAVLFGEEQFRKLGLL